MEQKDHRFWRAGSPWLALLEMALFLSAQLSFFATSFYRWDFSFLPDWRIPALALLCLAAGNHFPALKNAMTGKSFRRNLFVLCVLFALLAATRSAQVKYGKASLNSDRLVTSLMTRHIVEGKSRPVYFYGQQYQGCLNVYLYALTYRLLPDLQAAITLTNLLLFALALLVAHRLIGKFFTVPPLYYFLFMISLFTSLYYISLDTTRGFQLWALLFFSLLYSCYQAVFEKKDRLIICGLLGGLLFYHYQPSALVILFLLLWVFWQRKSLPAALLIAGGFLAGGFPHLLSEIQSHFAGSRMLIFHREAGGVALKNFLPIFFFPAHRFNNMILPPWTAYLFDLLFILGFGQCLVARFKTRSGKYLFLPLVYLVISTGLLLSGIVPQESRYRAHFVVYAILVAQFMAMPFSWTRIFAGKTAKVLWLGALCLFNGSAVAGFFHELRQPHMQNEAAIRKIAQLDETIILGGYWDTLRFAPFITGDKVILTAPSLRDPNVFNPGTVKYMPHVLTLAADWDRARCALLIKAGALKYVSRILRALALDFQTGELNDGLLLVHGFSRKPSLELAALLCTERLKKFAGLAEFIPVPGAVSSISLTGNTLHLETDMSDPQREASPYHKIILTHERLRQQVEIPFAFHGGAMDWRLPDDVFMPAGPYVLSIAFMDFPLLEQRMDIGTAAGTPPPHGAKMSFDRLSPRTRVLAWDAAVNREQGIAGSPATGLGCTILDPQATALHISLYSLLDFKGPGWYNQPQQELRVTRNGSRLRFPLRYGTNHVSLPVRYGDRIVLTTRYYSFFRVQVHGGIGLEGLEFVRTGAMVQDFSLQRGPGQESIKRLPQLTAQ